MNQFRVQEIHLVFIHSVKLIFLSLLFTSLLLVLHILYIASSSGFAV